MATHRITTPVPGFSGLVGNIMFHDGVAEVDAEVNAAELAYCASAGYIVEGIDASADESEAPASPAKTSGRKTAKTDEEPAK